MLNTILKCLLISILAVSCTNLGKKIKSFPIGVTQEQVLSQLGPPDHIEAEAGYKVWVYEQKIKTKRDQRYRRWFHRLFFEDEILAKKSKVLEVYKDEIEKYYRNIKKLKRTPYYN